MYPLPLPGLPRDVLLPLALRRSGAVTHAALCLVDARGAALRQGQSSFLHADELQRLSNMAADKRAADFLAGRYACKRALAQLAPGEDPRALCIAPGVFGQPLLQSARHLGLQVSISHGGGIGAALATPEAHPMGIDIEHYAEAALEAIAGQLTAAEQALLATLPLPRLQAMTAVWAMKEALSKVLRCGLMVPFALLELERFEFAAGQLAGYFRHFAQYRALAVDLGGFACAVALPRATDGLALGALVPAFTSLPDSLHAQQLAP